MRPETAAKIAKKIGMTDCGRGEWWDGDAFIVSAVNSTYVHKLTTYLATGDRPLRVMESMIRPCLSQDGTGEWLCMADDPDDHACEYEGRGTTPAAAILSCAEALEEGNE